MAVDKSEFFAFVRRVRSLYENGEGEWSSRYTLQDDDFYELVSVDLEAAEFCLRQLKEIKASSVDMIMLGEELNELVLHSDLSDSEKSESIILACRLMKSWYGVLDISFRILIVYGGRLSSRARKYLIVRACREHLIHPILRPFICRSTKS